MKHLDINELVETLCVNFRITISKFLARVDERQIFWRSKCVATFSLVRKRTTAHRFLEENHGNSKALTNSDAFHSIELSAKSLGIVHPGIREIARGLEMDTMDVRQKSVV